MPGKLYDLLWVHPLRRNRLARIAVALNSPELGARHNAIGRVRASIPRAILYPALLTPCVCVDAERLEVVLLTQARLNNLNDLREHINWQLALRPWQGPEKSTSSRPLFADANISELIQIHSQTDISTSMIEVRTGTEGRFSGTLDPRIVERYKKKGFTCVNCISIDASAFACSDALKHRFEYTTTKNQRVVLPECRQKETEPNHFMFENGDMLEPELDGNGRYGFPVEATDAKIGLADGDQLVQLYHPVIHRTQLGYAGIAHMGDIHLTARQQALAHSQARVIEHADFAGKHVGSFVNVCSQRVKELFDKFRGDPDVDTVIIGGDFVDFIQSWYMKDFQQKKATLTVKQIWDSCQITGGAVRSTLSFSGVSGEAPQYHNFVDFLTIHSFIIDFYTRSAQDAKPIFAVSGNHDCYEKPFGVSPRIIKDADGSKKGNEGIPADHNMTMYECILAAGPTYGAVMKGNNFTAERLIWFYSVFTPWANFSVSLPHQQVVGLAWGETENMIGATRPGGESQPVGHLPWADKAISDEQLAFLRHAVRRSKQGQPKKVILTTHFTFASYKEKWSELLARLPGWGSKNEQGDLYYTGAWYSTKDVSSSDMGTFIKNRQGVYKELVMDERIATGNSPIQIILTGHSHRRALYTFRRVDTWGNASIKTDYSDFPSNFVDCPRLMTAEGKQREEPWVVLSDSGGPIPRRNELGEFDGWGSDGPSGTKIAFHQNTGRVRAIERVPAGLKPRFIVALDYYDIMVVNSGTFSDSVLQDIESEPFVTNPNAPGDVQFTLRFHSEFARRTNVSAARMILPPGADADPSNMPVYDVNVTELTLYWVQDSRNCQRFALVGPPQPMDARSGWKLDASQLQSFRSRMPSNSARECFLAIKFAPGPRCPFRDIYDFSDPWTIEVDVTEKTLKSDLASRRILNPRHYFVVSRSTREVPDFAGRLRKFAYS